MEGKRLKVGGGGVQVAKLEDEKSLKSRGVQWEFEG